MKICLIRPPIVRRSRLNLTESTLPTGLAYLAGYLRHQGHEVHFVDAYGEAISRIQPLEHFPGVMRQGLGDTEILARIPQDSDCIGISSMFSSDWLLVQGLIAAIHHALPQIPLLAGGEHVTALADYCLRSAPGLAFIVLGEGEKTTQALLTALAQGGLEVARIPGLAWLEDDRFMTTGRAPRLRHLSELTRPAWDLLPLDMYFSHSNMSMSVAQDEAKTLPIIASRGCPYACTFCTSIHMWGKRWVIRSVENVLDEIQDYMQTYKIRNFDFQDQAGIIRGSWILEFCQQIQVRKLQFNWHIPVGTRLEALTPDMLRLMKASGCGYIGFPLESGSEQSLQRMQKQLNKARALQVLPWIIAAGLQTKVYFILGFPEEKFGDVLANYWTAIQCAWIGAQDATFFPVYPAPGSPLFHQLQREQGLEVNDALFLSLIPYENLAEVKSYCPTWSGRQLIRLCLFGMALFYTVNYLRRPWRLWRLLKEIHTRKTHSRLGYYLVRSLKNRQKARHMLDGMAKASVARK